MFETSVVVIARNSEKTIAKCIESLLKQTYQCEIIVVVGPSIDKTKEVVKSYHVKMVEAPLRDTYGVSRNIGVQQANGDIVLFQDADDIVEPNWCESLIRHFCGNQEVGIVVPKRLTPSIYLSDNWFLNLYNSRKISEKSQDKYAREGSWYEVNTKGSAFLKKAILEAGCFDEDMFFGTEDKELAFRIFKKGYKIIYDPNITVYCKPLSGIKEYLKDKFARSGLGHGHVRRKHGVYRPPLREISALFLFLLAVLLYNKHMFVCIFILLCSPIMLQKLILEVLNLTNESKNPFFLFMYFLIRFLGRLFEFLGFVVTFILPAKYLRKVNDAISK